jgi:hypothetical protein
MKTIIEQQSDDLFIVTKLFKSFEIGKANPHIANFIDSFIVDFDLEFKSLLEEKK